MSNNNYDFMKSGTSSSEYQYASDVYNEFNLKLTCLLRILMEKSMEVAGEYTDHSKRNTITCDDMIYALQYEAHEFMSAKNEEELTAKVNEYVTQQDTFKLFESIINSVEVKTESPTSVDTPNNRDNESVFTDQSSDEDDDDMSSIESDSDDDEEDDDFTESECKCDMCVKMNRYHAEWDNWNPTEDLEITFKNAIDKAIEKMKNEE